jgi:hypothetical protein
MLFVITIRAHLAELAQECVTWTAGESKYYWAVVKTCLARLQLGAQHLGADSTTKEAECQGACEPNA